MGEEHSASHFTTTNVVCMDYCVYALSILLCYYFVWYICTTMKSLRVVIIPQDLRCFVRHLFTKEFYRYVQTNNLNRASVGKFEDLFLVIEGGWSQTLRVFRGGGQQS